MSEIDVTYCKFARLNDVCASPINTQECKCSKIPIQMCYYKQLQQVIKDRDYYKQIVDDCKLENGNCSFCEIDKQLQQLKAENEELKQEILELKDCWENKE